ncbi:hypothetical protein LCGC14_2620180 [marine sediment metagenome]|uniref:Uncharacterized protein n=1 Tax=marine sediment metagenome TaxID=412755 RepID=A0A0F9A394_9ZZZZ
MLPFTKRRKLGVILLTVGSLVFVLLIVIAIVISGAAEPPQAGVGSDPPALVEPMPDESSTLVLEQLSNVLVYVFVATILLSAVAFISRRS